MSIFIKSARNSTSFPAFTRGVALRIKATFGEEKVRLGLQPHWGLRTRDKFKRDDFTGIVLKYTDDDGEWIRLTCDVDLEECKEIQRLSQRYTIKIIHHHKYSSAFGCRDSFYGFHVAGL
ncbi:hypothetical protein OIU78_001440 [Salix suchowensis]|nr:hypothetical protein OIU78_001440 [Salix suchowensis]